MLANSLFVRSFLCLVLLVIGFPSYGQIFLKVDPAPPLINVELGAVSLTDVTGDGFPDAFVTGQADGFTPTAQFLVNDGTGNFSMTPDAGFNNISLGDIATGDTNHLTKFCMNPCFFGK